MTGEAYREWLGRRGFLGLLGTAGAGALAGCPLRGGDGVHDVAHVSLTTVSPVDVQYNRFNPTDRAQVSRYVLFDAFAKFEFATGEFVPYLIADWEHDADAGTFELTVRDGAVWETGEPVTGGDVARQLELGSLVEPYGEYVDGVAAQGNAVTLDLAGDVNPRIVEHEVLSQVMFAHEGHYQPFLDDRSWTGEDADAAGPIGFADDEPVASGPFALAEATQSRLELSRNPDHPDAGTVDFERYVFEHPTGDASQVDALANLEIDSAFSLFVPSPVLDDLPEAVVEVRVPSKWGYGLVPNHDHEHLGDRAVRQAIAHVIDRERVAAAAAPRTKRPSSVPTAIPTDDLERWLGDAAGEFETYGVGESDWSSAEAVLADAGYTAEGASAAADEDVERRVLDGSGNRVSFALQVSRSWSDWRIAAETVVDQLAAFGFDVTLDARSFADLLDLWPSGEFDLTSVSWLPGGVRGAYPYFALRHQLVAPVDGVRYAYPPANAAVGGDGAEVTVQGRDGGETTIDAADELATLFAATDAGTAEAVVRDLAWVANRDLPMLPVVEKLEQSFLTDHVWEIPDAAEDVPKVRWPNTWLPRQGELRYVGDAGGS